MKLQKMVSLLSTFLILALFLSVGCRPAKHYTIAGECGEVMGNVINRVNSEDDCRVQCRNQCFSGDLDLSSSELVAGTEDKPCNSCECYCR